VFPDADQALVAAGWAPRWCNKSVIAWGQVPGSPSLSTTVTRWPGNSSLAAFSASCLSAEKTGVTVMPSGKSAITSNNRLIALVINCCLFRTPGIQPLEGLQVPSLHRLFSMLAQYLYQSQRAQHCLSPQLRNEYSRFCLLGISEELQLLLQLR